MMQLQVTFRHMPVSESLRELIHEQTRRLAARCDAHRCHVIVEGGATAGSAKRGPHRAHIVLEVAGPHGHLVANCGHEDAYAGVRIAFSTINRQLDRRAMRLAG